MNLPLDAVISKVTKHIQKEHAKSECRFIIAGSYMASLKAWEEKGWDLHFNDIDVFVSHSWRDDSPIYFGSKDDFKFQSLDYVDLGLDTEVNIINYSDLDLFRLINQFDINAIQVGVEVQVGSAGNVEKQWYISAGFKLFLETRCLRLDPDLRKLPKVSVSLIRILRKADQLKLKFQLPSRESLHKFAGGQCIGGRNIKKLEGLPWKYREIVESLFDLEELFWTPPNEFKLLKFNISDDSDSLASLHCSRSTEDSDLLDYI